MYIVHTILYIIVVVIPKNIGPRISSSLYVFIDTAKQPTHTLCQNCSVPRCVVVHTLSESGPRAHILIHKLKSNQFKPVIYIESTLFCYSCKHCVSVICFATRANTSSHHSYEHAILAFLGKRHEHVNTHRTRKEVFRAIDRE